MKKSVRIAWGAVATIMVAVAGSGVWYWYTGQREIAIAEQIVRNSVKDPASVQFDRVSYRRDTSAVCGRFNARNGFGGYVGFRRFVRVADGTVHLERDYPQVPGQTDQMSFQQLAKLQQSLESAKGVAELMLKSCGDRI